MNIAMATNNYLPHIGGVARSVASFTRQYRNRGHRVLVIAPHNKRQYTEPDLILIPAIQLEITQQEIDLPLPIPGIVATALKKFLPDIIHSHHPFILGDTALLSAVRWNVPLTFTHHTMYEHYTHYASADSPRLKQFVIELSTGYANLCDCVFVPTASVASIIKQRGVTTRLEVVPTGIDIKKYGHGSGIRLRQQLRIPSDAFVVGHVGRLGHEKNLFFLMGALIHFLETNIQAHVLIVGDGPLLTQLQDRVRKASLEQRIHFMGALQNEELVNAYHAMDIFAFASLSETQGLVLIEALAAGVPVIALDAPGPRDILKNTQNGWLVRELNEDHFAERLRTAHKLISANSEHFRQISRQSSLDYDASHCADQALKIYQSLLTGQLRVKKPGHQNIVNSPWLTARRLMTAEWNLWSNRLSAIYSALQTP